MRWLLLTLLVACAAEGPDRARVATNELRVPLEPRREIDLVAYLTSPGELQPVTLPLALGEGYPTTISVRVSTVWANACGLDEGPWAIEAATLEEGAVSARVAGGELALDVHGEGDVSLALTIRGVGPCEGAGESSLTLPLTVTVARPAGVVWWLPHECREAGEHLVLANAPMGTLVYLPEGPKGPFQPANASAQGPIGLTITGPEGATVTLDSSLPGLSGLRIAGATGALHLVPDLGDPLVMRVVGAEDVDEMAISYALLGYGGGGMVLTDGETYGEDGGYARTADVVGVAVTGLTVQSVPLCTQPPAWAFTLSSDDPAVCQPIDGDGGGEYKGGAPIGKAARVLGDGVCGLRVDAPSFAGGAGLSSTLSVTLLNTEFLLSTAGE